MTEKKNLGILYALIAAIVLLFTAMLVLCGMYLDLRLNGAASSLPVLSTTSARRRFRRKFYINRGV